MTKKSNHYVDNEKFLQALIDHTNERKKAEAEGRPEPQISNYIGECILKISENISHLPRFSMYSFREEMVGDGIENCLRYYRNFDPTVSKNPFAYFSQISYWAFVRRIKKEKKELYGKYKATQQFSLLDEGEMFEDADGNMRQFQLYDNINEFIETYERSMDAKKAKKKEKEILDIVGDSDVAIPKELIEDDDNV